MALSKDKILEIINGHLQDTNGTQTNEVGEVNLEDSLSLYLGRPDGKEIEGRSHVVSTDVADAIEWIMPQVMKSFTQNNEIVVFDPVHDGDEKQAELESEYVYEILMKQNDGFIILYQFVKDALMQKNGILKVYYAEKTENKVKDWTGITEEQLEMLLAADGIELLEKDEYVDQTLTIEKQQTLKMQLSQLQEQAQQAMSGNQQITEDQMIQYRVATQRLQAELDKPVILFNVKVTVVRKRGQIYVDPIPPEDRDWETTRY